MSRSGLCFENDIGVPVLANRRRAGAMFRVMAAALLCAITTLTIATRSAATPDDTYWSSEFSDGIGRATTAALAVYDGALYLAGDFDYVHGHPFAGIARWDGTSWSSVGSGLSGGLSGKPTPRCMVTTADGLIVAGDFSTAGGTAAANIARWDGSSWHPVGSGLPGDVWSILADGETLYAGVASGFDGSDVYRWSSSSWTSIGHFDGFVDDLVIFEGDLIAGGWFTGDVARWNGTSWSMIAGSGSNGRVETLIVHDGVLMAGGSFYRMNGVFTGPVARWNGGSNWSNVDIPEAWEVYSLVTFDGNLVAGGWDAMHQWDGTSWTWLGGGMSGLRQMVFDTIEFQGGLIAVGSFVRAGGGVAWSLAIWDGMTWAPLGSPTNRSIPDGFVSRLANFDGKLAAGGSFAEAGNVAANNVALFDGNAWSQLGTGMNGTVYALVEFDGQLIAGGIFSTAGDGPASNIAAWNGSSWSPLAGGTNGSVHALLVRNDRLVVGGSFTTAGGVPASRIAEWDGVGWSNIGTGLNNTVMALNSYGGQLVAGGYFSSPANRIARFDGINWIQLGTGVNGPVFALEQFGGELVAGGAFVVGNCSCVGSWDGLSWKPLSRGFGGSPFWEPETWVKDLAIDGGRLIAVGPFSHDPSNSQVLRCVASWDGIGWSPLGSGIDFEYDRAAYAVEAFGSGLYVGGTFTGAGGKTSLGIARWGDPSVSATPELPISSLLRLTGRPNPFENQVSIDFELVRQSRVQLTVHDVQGRRVRSLIGGQDIPAGSRRIDWDGRTDAGVPVSAGPYFVRLRTDSGTDRLLRVVRIH